MKHRWQVFRWDRSTPRGIRSRLPVTYTRTPRWAILSPIGHIHPVLYSTWRSAFDCCLAKIRMTERKRKALNR